MKQILFLIVFFFQVNIAYSQQYDYVTVTNEFYEETHAVLRLTGGKHGNYLKINVKTFDTLAMGRYEDNKKTGTWQYFGYDKKPFIVYDYNNNQINYIREDLLKVDSFPVRNENGFGMTKVERPPIYLGHEDEIFNLLTEKIKPSNYLLIDKLSCTTIASFIVDKDGVIKNIKVDKVDKPYDLSVENAIKSINGKWLPAVVNGRYVDAKIDILINIDFVKAFNDPYKSQYKEMPCLFVINKIYMGVNRRVQEEYKNIKRMR